MIFEKLNVLAPLFSSDKEWLKGDVCSRTESTYIYWS